VVRVRHVGDAVLWGRPVQRSVDCVADALTVEVMRGLWRACSLCAEIDSFDRCGRAEQQRLCGACPVSEPCFWAALVEERGFRSSAGVPPGVRGGVEGSRRRFILGELSDAELMVRYRRAVDELDSGGVGGLDRRVA
jgi:hypothetical protein